VTFNSYLRGARGIPGSLLARLVEYVGWDWAWNLAKDERPIVAKAMLWDPNTETRSSIQAMLPYFCLLREAGDIEGHERFVSDLAVRFPETTHPLEALTALHGDCLMNSPGPKNSDESCRNRARMNRWIKLRKLLGAVESKGIFDSKLHVAIIRDMGIAFAFMWHKEVHLKQELVAHLASLRADLKKCESLLDTPLAWCFHFSSLAHVDVALGERRQIERSLDQLQRVCASLGAQTEVDAAPLWVRYRLARFFELEVEGRVDDATAELIVAADLLRKSKIPLWELDVRRKIQDRSQNET